MHFSQISISENIDKIFKNFETYIFTHLTQSLFSGSVGRYSQLKLLPENNLILFGHRGEKNDIKNLIFSQIPVVLHL